MSDKQETFKINIVILIEASVSCTQSFKKSIVQPRNRLHSLKMAMKH